MQKYSNVVQDRLGRAIANAKVTVTLAGGGIAALFSDNGVTGIDNPLSTDSLGHFAFYAADGRYNLTVAVGSAIVATENDILLEDPADGSAAIAAPGGSALMGFIQSGTGAVARTVQDELRKTFTLSQFATSAQAVVEASGKRLIIGPGESITLNVPSQFPTVQAALAAVDAWEVAATGQVTIQVADGTLNLTSSLVLNHPFGRRFRLIGNQTTPDNCILRTPNPPTFDAVICSDGHNWGFIDGFMIDCAAKAGAANNFTGLLAVGHASIICGAKMKTNNLYYGIAARDHSYIRCDNAVVNNAGDVGIWAYNGSMIDASNAVATNSADVANSLGFGIQAEYGSTINCDGANTSGNQIAGIAALSGGVVRCPTAISSNNTGSGFYARDGSQIVAHSGTANTNGRFGIEVLDKTSRITGNSMTLTGNTKGPIGPARTPGANNLLINPEFTVAQFGTTFANPNSGDYTIDRWRVRKAAGAGTLPTINVKQNSAAAFGDGVTNCLELEITAVGSFGSGAFWLVEQPLANPAAFRGKTLTGQFLIWASAPITLSARAEITDSGGTSTSSTLTSLSTTPRLVTVTRTVDAAASTLAFDLSLFLGNISGTASIYVASAQLRDDLYPTPVEVSADAQAELLRCLPYAERLLVDTNEAIGMADAHSTTSCRTVIHHYPKRRLPLSTEVTVSNAANFSLQANNTSVAMSSVGGINAGRRASTINFTTSGLTQGTAGYLRASADGQYVDIRAEV